MQKNLEVDTDVVPSAGRRKSVWGRTSNSPAAQKNRLSAARVDRRMLSRSIFAQAVPADIQGNAIHVARSAWGQRADPADPQSWNRDPLGLV